MRFQGAIIKEQGIIFAVVLAKPHILNDHLKANQLIGLFQQSVFGSIPVVLIARNFIGEPTYYGRRDIANFLSRVPLQTIPWKEYTIG